MKNGWRIKAAALALAAAGGLVAAADALAQAGEIFVPVLVYRTGPYAPNGVPWADGFVDYLKLVNERDGGIDGVKIAYEECETGYATDRGVECYERLKSKKPVAFSPLSTGITYALTEKAPGDHIVLITAGYGRADSVDGSVFRWNFPMMGTYWDGADILVQHVKKKEHGSLKGKKIALVYHDSPYGKEPIPVLEALAKKEGFQLMLLPVTHPGVEQKATWLQIRQQRPNYVFLWGWGVMNSTAIKEAAAVGYPRDKMIGVWWSGAEPDVTPAGDQSIGYKALMLQHPAGKFGVHADLEKFVVSKGKSVSKDDFAQVLYNRGLINSMLGVEAIRKAQDKYGKGKVMTPEQVRWGLEHLDLTEARLKELGASGLFPPVKTSCMDHEGSGMVKFQQWDGKEFKTLTPFMAGDRAMVRKMVQQGAEKYAAEKKITPRDCSKEM
jgi:branched-chain amino acid transport system substrate-binding protein